MLAIITHAKTNKFRPKDSDSDIVSTKIQAVPLRGSNMNGERGAPAKIGIKVQGDMVAQLEYIPGLYDMETETTNFDGRVSERVFFLTCLGPFSFPDPADVRDNFTVATAKK